MNGKWKLNKAENFGSYRASFLTLFEDQRDQMSDSTRPEWEVSQRRENRLVEIRDGSGKTLFRKVCSKEEGNAIYRKLVSVYCAGSGASGIMHWIAEASA